MSREIEITFEAIERMAEKRGGYCLSSGLKSAGRGRLEYLEYCCAEGHEWRASPYDLFDRKWWCPECEHNKEEEQQKAKEIKKLKAKLAKLEGAEELEELEELEEFTVEEPSALYTFLRGLILFPLLAIGITAGSLFLMLFLMALFN